MSEEETKAGVKTNPAMDKATKDGWRPEAEYEGDPTNWVDYREFNVRGELMSRIQDQSGALAHNKSEIGELRQVVEDLKEMQSKATEHEFKRIVKLLKQQKADAISESDGEAVAEIEQQIETLTEQHEVAMLEPDIEVLDEEPETVVPPEIQAWLARPENQWYNSDMRMQAYANSVAAELAQAQPGITPAEVLRQMDAEVRKEMPHKFKHSKVGTGDSLNRNNSTTRGLADLTDEEQAVAKRFVKQGVFKNVGEYIEQLDAIGE